MVKIPERNIFGGQNIFSSTTIEPVQDLTHMSEVLDYLNKNDIDNNNNSLGIFSSDIRRSVGSGSTLETERTLSNMVDGEDFVFYDFETIGKMPQQNHFSSLPSPFTPTELAFQKTKFQNNRFHKTSDFGSILIQPKKEMETHIEGLLNTINKNPFSLTNGSIDQDDRRLLLRLFSYGEAKTSKQTFNGMEYISLDGAGATPTSISALTVKKDLPTIRKGFNLIKSGTPIDVTADIFNSAIKGAGVAGQNINNFDQFGIYSLSKSLMSNEKTKNKGRQTWATYQNAKKLDSYEMMNLLPNQNSALGSNMNLGNVYFNSTGKILDGAHTGFVDVSANIDIVNQSIRESQTIAKNSKKDYLSTNSIFHVKRGPGTYTNTPGADYNNHRGIYNVSMIKGQDGQWQMSRPGREPAIIGGNSYRIKQQLKNVPFGADKIPHYMMVLENIDTGDHSAIVAESMGQLGSYFSSKNVSTDSALSILSRRKDNSRRRWDRIVKPSQNNHTNDAVSDIKKMYENLDNYQARLAQIQEAEPNLSIKNAQERAIRDVHKAAVDGQNLDNFQYRYSYDKIRSVVDLEKTLTDIRPFAEETMAYATKNGNSKQQRNALVESMFGKYHEAYGADIYDVQERHGLFLPRSVGGEVNYLDITTTDSIKNKIFSLSSSGNHASISKRMEDYLTDISGYGALSQDQVKSFTSRIRKDLKNQNKVSATLANEISTFIQENGSKLPTALNEVHINKKVTEPIRRTAFSNGLRSKSSNYAKNQFGSWATQSLEEIMSTISSSGTFGASAARISAEVANASFVTDHFDFQDKMHAMIRGNSKVNGLYKDSNKNAYFNSLNEILNGFDRNKFETSIFQDETTNRLMLFFGESGTVVGKQAKDLRSSRSVSQIELPILTSNNTVSFQGTNYQNRFFYKGEKSAQRYVDLSQKFLEDLKYLPDDMRSEINRLRTNGIKFNSYQDVANSRVNRQIYSTTQSLSERAFLGDKSSEHKRHRTSPLSNAKMGMQLDTGEAVNEWLAKTHPEMNAIFERQRKNNPKINKWFDVAPKEYGLSINDFNNLRSQMNFGFTDFFNNNIGSKDGVKLSVNGTSGKNAGRGIYSGLDVRKLSPGGMFQSTSHERVEKALNYATIDREETISRLMLNRQYSRLQAESVVGNSMVSNAGRYFGADNETSHLNMTHRIMNDEQISQKLAGFDKKRSMLMEEINTLKLADTSNPSIKHQIAAKQKEYEKVSAILNEASAASTFDGQMIMRKSMADSMTRVNAGHIKLNGTEIDSSFKSFLIEHGFVDTDYDFTNSLDFNKGGLHHDYLDKYGLLDKNGQVTIGKTADYQTEKSRIKTKDYKITGYDAKLQAFRYEERLGLNNSDKIITKSGQRATVNILPDYVVDAIAGSDIDLIGTAAGLSKGAGGVHQLELINTAGKQIQSSLIDVAEGRKSLSSLPRALQKNIGKTTIQDLANTAVQTNVLNKTMKPLFRELGLDGQISYQTSNNGISLVESFSNAGILGNKEAASKFGQVLDSFSKEHGLNIRGDVTNTEVAFHDVAIWGGASSKAQTSSKEYLAIKNTLSKSGVNNEVADEILNRFKTPTSIMDIESHKEARTIASQIINHEKIVREGIDPLHRKNSIIFDVSGGYSGSPLDTPTSVAATSYNGAVHIDMSNTKKKMYSELRFGQTPGQGTSEALNTILMPSSMNITLENGTQTVGDLATNMTAANRSESAMFMKLPNIATEEARVSAKYIPMIDVKPERLSVLDKDTQIHLKAIQTSQASIYQNATEMLNQDGPISRKAIESFNDSIMEHQSLLNKYLTGTGSGSFEKGAIGVSQEMSGAFKASSRNVSIAYERTSAGLSLRNEAAEATVAISPKEFRKIISGNELAIAEAIDLKDRISVADLSKMNTDVLTKEIVQALDVRNGVENTAVLNAMFSRQPTTGSDSYQARRLVLDSALESGAKSNMNIGPMTNKLMNGDFDGDYIYSMLSMYNKPENAKLINDQLGKVSNYQLNMVKQLGPQHVLSELGSIGSSELTSVGDLMKELSSGIKYNDYGSNNIGDEFLNIVSHEQGSFIGQVNNFTARQNAAVDVVADRLLATNQFSHTQVAALRRRTDALNYVFAQMPIGTKHIESSIFDGKDVGELLKSGRTSSEDYINYRNNMSKAMNTIQGLEYNNKQSLNQAVEYFDSLLPQDKLIGALKKGGFQDVTSENYKGHLYELANDFALTNQAVGKNAQLGYHGDLGTIRKDFLSPTGIPTEALKDISSMYDTSLPSRQIAGIDSRLKDILGNTDSISIGDILNTDIITDSSRNISTSTTTFKQTGLDNWNEFLNSSRGKKIMNSSSQAANDMADKVAAGANKMKSSAGGFLTAGAVIGGIWAASAMARREPTPEGNEAQQEATQVEVNPSLLLTSPTARVTPNSESISLKVRSSGGLVHDQAAAIINEQISQMTGVSMNMNVNVNDNTTTLNKAWFEKNVNNAMGF